MKVSILSIVFSSLLFTGCLQDECQDTLTYRVYEPVVVSAADWRSSTFTMSEPTEVCDPTGFYVYGDYLFILDRNAGMHIFDNRDNNNPRSLSFINIPGGQGLAVRNDILYVNQYIDLLAFDLSDPREPALLHRTEDVFEVYSVFAGQLPGSGEYIIDYSPTDQTRELECGDPNFGHNYWLEDRWYSLDRALSITTTSGNFTGPERVGQGGSLARFTIANGTLYTIDNSSLRTFSLADPAKPAFVGTTDLGWGIETIFPYKDQLYIGSTTGMHIYDASNPHAPQHLSTFEHVRSCDPVVVQNDIAYVTMWGGSICGNETDRLLVINVHDPRYPQQMQSVRMQQSHGLGVSGDRLYLCTGTAGLKVFALTEAGRLGPQIGSVGGFNARDVIVRSDRQELIALGWDREGMRQYDYTHSGELQAVSDIPICTQP